MKKQVTLGVHSALAIIAIVLLTTFYSPTYGLQEDYPFLSSRLCGADSVSVYRASPPQYPGGVTRHSNVVCIPKGEPITAEGFGNTFPDAKRSEPWKLFDRFRPQHEYKNNPWYYD